MLKIDEKEENWNKKITKKNIEHTYQNFENVLKNCQNLIFEGECHGWIPFSHEELGLE